jgi:beta-glucanase (GH16 family)
MGTRATEICKTHWKRAVVLFLAVILLCDLGSKHAFTQSGAGLDLSKFQITFSEEFDSLSVSPWGPNTRWIAHTPWAGDFGDAQFADPRLGVFPFTINDGILRIEAKKNAAGKWESGLLASADSNGRGFSQQYGYFEMRAKLPKGKGVWPAFWLSSVADPKATTSIELDVVEFYGHAPDRFQSVIHTWYVNPADKAADKAPDIPVHFTMVPPDSLSDNFNDFGVLVGKETVTFYLNKKEIWREATPAKLSRPFIILLNLALGSGFPIDETPNPSYMYVDYVRAYKKSEP